MTATSGPGWALMIETAQYALMTETPVVIALVQRLGPSTGGSTQGAQGDVWLAEFSTSGGYTLPVFSPSNATECFELAIHAFNWSERLRTPVLLLSDKEVGMTSEAVDDSTLPISDLVDRKRATAKAGYLPYEAQEPEGVPAFAAVGGEIKATVTGSAHDFQGRLRKNSPQVLNVLHRLQRKIEVHAEEMALVKPDLDPEARSPRHQLWCDGTRGTRRQSGNCETAVYGFRFSKSNRCFRFRIRVWRGRWQASNRFSSLRKT